MTRKIAIVAATCLLVAGAAVAQDAGGIPQQVQRQMENAMSNLLNDSLGLTEEAMKGSVGKEKMDSFLGSAVVKLTLAPDGNFTAYSLRGGELVRFVLGKDKINVDDKGSWEENWLMKSGDYSAPKKAQELSLTMSAGGREVTVDCYNKFKRGDSAVTYYVGPLNGLFCMGLAEEDEAG